MSIWRSSPVGTLPSVARNRRRPAHGSNVVLQTGPAETFAGLVDVHLDILGLNRTERDLLRFEVIQKTVEPRIDGERRWTPRIRELHANDSHTPGSESLARTLPLFRFDSNDQAGGGEISLQCPHGSGIRREDLDEITPAIVERRVG